MMAQSFACQQMFDQPVLQCIDTTAYKACVAHVLCYMFCDTVVFVLQESVLIGDCFSHAEGDSNQGHARDTKHRCDFCPSCQNLPFP